MPTGEKGEFHAPCHTSFDTWSHSRQSAIKGILDGVNGEKKGERKKSGSGKQRGETETGLQEKKKRHTRRRYLATKKQAGAPVPGGRRPEEAAKKKKASGGERR